MCKTFFGVKRLCTLALCCMAFVASYADVNPKPFVIPEIQSWKGAEGQFVPSGRIVVKGGPKAKAVAQLFASDYKAMFGKTLIIVSGKASKGDFVIQLKNNKKMGSEEYALNIAETATVIASTEQALIWGTRTILQISDKNSVAARAFATEPAKSADLALPKGQILDKPEYALRGFMMDCGRKFIPMSYLRNLVKMMSYYKMNTLHVHLNDNGFRQFFADDWNKTQAAFRLESTTYPGLTAKDGSYSKAEFIDFQKLAEEYGVEIIPEIDVPAHSLAFTHYKPEIGSKEYGMDHLDLFNPETYKFVDGLFKEYLEGKEPVFRGKKVHIGTDEYSNAKKDVVEKFRYFTDRYIKYVEKFGKQAVVWGALTHAKGDTPVKSENVIMDCWYNGYANPKDMKEQGYKLVSISDGLMYIVPAAGYYYDYLNCQYLYEHWTPANIGGQVFEENDPAILGGMFAVWNDHAGNGISVKDIHDRLFPALQTLSVKCWTGKNTTLPYAEFNSRRAHLSEAPAVNEYGRFPEGAEYKLAEVKPNQKNAVEEVGYGYTVEFTVEGAAEKKGTTLFTSENAKFYLADPVEGKLGFERDGYLNTFNYRIPAGQKVTIKIQGDNTMTRLFVNGEKKEELGPLTIYAMKASDKTRFQDTDANAWKPEMYNPGTKMFYQRTLVFPLRNSGDFKSKVSDLKVKNTL